MVNREIRLRARPCERARAGDFESVDVPVAPLAHDEVLVDVRWLSIDPYQNERVIGARLGPRIEPGARMIGRGVGRVIDGALPAGTRVAGELGWQRYAVVKASSVSTLDDANVEDRTYLGALGVPGLTAWLALFDVAQGRPGEVLVVTSAAGAVGSIAGQLARRAGLHVVGVTSGAGKCAALVAGGFDAAVDRLGVEPLSDAIARTCAAVRSDRAASFDVLLDLVGGRMLEAALHSAASRARVVLCGHVGAYRDAGAKLDAEAALYRRLSIRGFLVHDHAHRFADARAALAEALREGALVVRETIHEGLDAAPAALERLLSGDGIGKHLVRVA